MLCISGNIREYLGHETGKCFILRSTHHRAMWPWPIGMEIKIRVIFIVRLTSTQIDRFRACMRICVCMDVFVSSSPSFSSMNENCGFDVDKMLRWNMMDRMDTKVWRGTSIAVRYIERIEPQTTVLYGCSCSPNIYFFVLFNCVRFIISYILVDVKWSEYVYRGVIACWGDRRGSHQLTSTVICQLHNDTCGGWMCVLLLLT